MKKLIGKFNFFIDNLKFEYLLVFIVVFLVFISMAREFSAELTKGNSNLLLSVLGVALAYAVFFISYKENFINNENEKRKIKNLIEGLFTSSFFPVIAVLATSGKVDFGLFNQFIVWTFVILVMLSLFIFSFCIIDLWLFMLKKIVKEFITKIKKL